MDEKIQEIRHECHHMMFILKKGGIELMCTKCKYPILYTWVDILTMMLMAEKTPNKSPAK